MSILENPQAAYKAKKSILLLRYLPIILLNNFLKIECLSSGTRDILRHIASR